MKSYIGKRCWQARGFTTLSFGNIVNQKMENDWLLVEVRWSASGDATWERVVNVSFECINSWKLTS